MKNINQTLRQVRTLLDEHSPVILTGMAIAGLGTSVYLTAKGAFKAKDAIVSREIEQGSTLTGQEKFLLTYKFYAPAAVTTIATAGCMVMATKIGLNRTAALGAALVVAERGNEQYRDKVKEILGDTKDQKVNDAVAAERIQNMAPFESPREGEQIFVDAWTGRRISTTMEKMERALNDYNKEMLHNRYMSLNELYARVGLDDIQMGNSIGWNVGKAQDKLLEFDYTTVLKDDREVVMFKFDRNPMPTFRDGGDEDI